LETWFTNTGLRICKWNSDTIVGRDPWTKIEGIPEILPPELAIVNENISSSDTQTKWEQGPTPGEYILKYIDNNNREKLVASFNTDSDTFTITTDKNEIATFSYDRFGINNNSLSIADDKGAQLLKYGTEGWSSDHLYLSVGQIRARYKLLDINENGLPTVLFDSEPRKVDNFVISDVMAVLVDKPITIDIAKNQITFTAGFYDIRGNLHTYRFVAGGQTLNGKNLRTANCYITDNSEQCGSLDINGVKALLDETFSPNQKTKSIGLEIVSKDTAGNSTNISGEVNNHSEYIARLLEALIAGDNFPETNEDFRLYTFFLKVYK
jgi:hypothetical protein